jgi:hypothetical protein
MFRRVTHENIYIKGLLSLVSTYEDVAKIGVIIPMSGSPYFCTHHDCSTYCYFASKRQRDFEVFVLTNYATGATTPAAVISAWAQVSSDQHGRDRIYALAHSPLLQYTMTDIGGIHLGVVHISETVSASHRYYHLGKDYKAKSSFKGSISNLPCNKAQGKYEFTEFAPMTCISRNGGDRRTYYLGSDEAPNDVKLGMLGLDFQNDSYGIMRMERGVDQMRMGIKERQSRDEAARQEYENARNRFEEANNRLTTRIKRESGSTENIVTARSTTTRRSASVFSGAPNAQASVANSVYTEAMRGSRPPRSMSTGHRLTPSTRTNRGGVL